MDKLTDKKIQDISKLHYLNQDATDIEIAEILEISYSSVYKYRPKKTVKIQCANKNCNNLFLPHMNRKYCCDKCRPDYNEKRMKAMSKQQQKIERLAAIRKKFEKVWDENS